MSPASGQPAAWLRDAVVVFAGFPALAGLTLEVDRGEVVLLRGANGAGKSTLLHLCAGLLRLSSGSGRILGCDLATSRAEVRRRVGLLGHDSGLYGELSAAENLRFWAQAARLVDSGSRSGSAAQMTQIDGALERLGLPERLWDVPVASLSEGQRRRVAMAAIVLRRPELWLLDEPFAGLDGDGRSIVDDLIATASASGATVILAAHEHVPEATFGAREVTLAGGMCAAGQAHPMQASIT